MRWRRRPTIEQLQRWIASDDAASLERWIDDPVVTDHLERLTALSPETVLALEHAVAPVDGFQARTMDAVGERVDDLERVGVLFGLLGLGPRIAGSWIESDRD